MKKLILLLSIILLASCGGDDTPKEKPKPIALTPDDVGYYMQMIVADHAGPKAQLWLDDKSKPIWFVDVRDAINFTRTPEEADNISVIYAHDMAKNPDYRNVKDIWVELDKAVFVIKSRKKGGMGMPETIPFSDKTIAEEFIKANGGELVNSAAEITDEYLHSMGDTTNMDPIDRMKCGGSMKCGSKK